MSYLIKRFVGPRKTVKTLMDVSGIARGVITALVDCTRLDLQGVRSLAVTVEGCFGSGMISGIEVKAVTSIDDVGYDKSGQWYTLFDPEFVSGGADFRYTKAITPDPRYMKFQVYNVDLSGVLSGVKLTAVIGR